MTNAKFSLKGNLIDAQISFISIDASNQKYVLLVETKENQYNFPMSLIHSNVTDLTLTLKTPLNSEPITLLFDDENTAKHMHNFITTKSDVHHANDMMDSLDKNIQTFWPFPCFSYPGFSPHEL